MHYLRVSVRKTQIFTHFFVDQTEIYETISATALSDVLLCMPTHIEPKILNANQQHQLEIGTSKIIVKYVVKGWKEALLFLRQFSPKLFW